VVKQISHFSSDILGSIQSGDDCFSRFLNDFLSRPFYATIK
jgi:hypothetical protein